MAAYATDPAYRSLGLQRVLASAESDLKQFSSSPGRIVSREASALVRSGDKRWKFPNLAQLQSITMQDIEKVVAPSLKHGPIEISVVGDLQEELVVKAIAETFGALPKRLATLPEPANGRVILFPRQPPKLTLQHEGGSDQASAYVAWAAPDFYSNPKRSRTISLLREMLKVRLTEEFREVQGATYSPSASSNASTTFPGYGYITASAETKPELVEGFFKTLDGVIAELSAGNFSDDLIDRARTPIVKSIEKSRLGNGFWVGSLSDVQTDPRGLDAIRTQLSDVQAITKTDLVEAAKQFLLGKPRLELRVLPGKPKSASLDQSDTTTSRAYKAAQSRSRMIRHAVN
jgi:zinc protease